MSWIVILRIVIFIASLFVSRGTGEKMTEWLKDGQERRKARRDKRNQR